jgi:hypothetical protein
MTSRTPTHRPSTSDAVEARARRALTDTRFARLRTRRARVGLVAAQIGSVVLTPVAWLVGGAIPGIIAVIAAVVVLALLRRSVRVVADLPEEYLDERQLALRNEMYVEAYRYLAGIVVVLASAGLIAFMVQADDADTWSVELTWNHVMAAFWVVQLLALALPSMAVALRDGDELPVDPAG